MFKVFCGITTYELGDDFGADGHPQVVDPEWFADLFCVIERCLRVTVCNDENILFGEDLKCGLKCWTDDGGRFIAGNKEGG